MKTRDHSRRPGSSVSRRRVVPVRIHHVYLEVAIALGYMKAICDDHQVKTRAILVDSLGRRLIGVRIAAIRIHHVKLEVAVALGLQRRCGGHRETNEGDLVDSRVVGQTASDCCHPNPSRKARSCRRGWTTKAMWRPSGDQRGRPVVGWVIGQAASDCCHPNPSRKARSCHRARRRWDLKAMWRPSGDQRGGAVGIPSRSVKRRRVLGCQVSATNRLPKPRRQRRIGRIGTIGRKQQYVGRRKLAVGVDIAEADIAVVRRRDGRINKV